MKELNAEAYVSCLTLIFASGSSVILARIWWRLLPLRTGLFRLWLSHRLERALAWHVRHQHIAASPQWILRGLFSFLPLVWFHTVLFSLYFYLSRQTCNLGQECGWAGRRRGSVSAQVQRWYEQVSEALMFLGRLQIATDWSDDRGAQAF